MDKNEFYDELIGVFEDGFREEIKKDVESGKMSQEQYDAFLPVINIFISLFAWKSVQITLELILSGNIE